MPKYNSIMRCGKGVGGVRIAAKKKRSLRRGMLKFAIGGARRQFPWREPGRTPYEVLIAEVLLKRTTSTAAARVYNDFLRRYPSPADLSVASRSELARVFAKLGLQRQRSAAAKKLALHLVRIGGGEVPSSLKLLLQVPGVGEYSARAVLSVGFKKPAAIVDSNVERIIHRVFANSIPARTPLSLLQAVVDTLLPQTRHREFNLGMLDLGALVCRPSSPRCLECPLTKICDYYAIHRSKAVKREFPHASKVGVQLRRIRKQKSLSLVRLALASKLSKLTIIRIENGKSSPLPRTIKKLEDALGITLPQINGE